MEVDDEVPAAAAASSTPSVEKGGKKRFEVKKWNAVALWAWDIVVDNCAICRNHIMDLCIECQANQVDHEALKVYNRNSLSFVIFNFTRRVPPARSARWPGGCVTTPSTSTASPDGSRPGRSARSTTGTGSSRSTDTKKSEHYNCTTIWSRHDIPVMH